MDHSDVIETLARDGIAVVRGVWSEEQCRRAIRDIMGTVERLPYTEPVAKRWKEIATHVTGDPWGPCPPDIARDGIAYYPTSGSFSALTTPPFFHLATQWEARCEAKLISLYESIYGSRDLLTTIDRVSLKFPGGGATEFAHWDSNPHEWSEVNREGYQGILSLYTTKVYAKPGSHTDAFRDEFIKLYPQKRAHDQYVIDAKQDPLKLRSACQAYDVGPGDFVIFSNRLLHEVRKNKSDRIRFAYYVSYFPRDSPSIGSEVAYDKAGVDRIADRLASYQTGLAPFAFPSGTRVALWAKSSLMYHPDVLNNYCALFTTGSTPYTYKTGAKRGRVVNLPIEWDPIALGLYTPLPLSRPIRRLLLGE